MNVWTQKHFRHAVCLTVTCLIVGCSGTETTKTDPADAKTSELLSDMGKQAADTPPGNSPDSVTGSNPLIGDQAAQSDSPVDHTFEIEDPDAATSPERPLRKNLTPQELLVFLGGADRDLQLIGSGRAGISDARKARSEMKRITKMKLEASRRLKDHQDADPESRIEGARGELQSLSTMASLGDVKSADELEELAKSNLNSKDESLASDSRMVLIGFAIESFQNGNEDAADGIVDLIDDLAASASSPDMPAMMVMGQAREVLARLGQPEKAKRVRDKIIELFADSSDPDIARMAAQVAGNVRFDSIDKLRASAAAGETVSVAQWQEAAGTLIDESADLLTVQYLAGAALEFEAIDNDDLATATYEVLTSRFDDPDEATGREVKTAVQARLARKEVIGEEFDPTLPSTGAKEISMPDYLGKVVLMPFWATGFPESLQVIDLLKEIRRKHPEKVEIIGMNVDPAGFKVDAYADEQLGFTSFRSESTEAATMGNPQAARFGVVSMPFVVIINQKGVIEAIDFSGRKLGPAVERLLNE